METFGAGLIPGPREQASPKQGWTEAWFFVFGAEEFA